MNLICLGVHVCVVHLNNITFNSKEIVFSIILTNDTFSAYQAQSCKLAVMLKVSTECCVIPNYTFDCQREWVVCDLKGSWLMTKPNQQYIKS